MQNSSNTLTINLLCGRQNWHRLTAHSPEHRTLPQILHQICHVPQMPAQQSLLLLRPLRVSLLIRPLRLGPARCVHVRDREPRIRGGFGHQVEVEELDGFHLDFSARGAGFEQRGDGEEPVEGFECAGVAGGAEEGGDEGVQRGGVDGGAEDWVEEVEEELSGSARAIGNEGALSVVEGSI